MSLDTHDRCCGEAMRKGCSVEDLYCGGPLVIDERIEADIRAGIEAIRARRARELSESLYTPATNAFYGLGDEPTCPYCGVADTKECRGTGCRKPLGVNLFDGAALGSAEHPAGDQVPEDADISVDAVETVEVDLEDEGQRLADLLALVRPPDDTFSYNDVVCGRHERYDQWNKPLDQNGVLLISRGDMIMMALLHYGTEDYAEILKRFSDPEFRAAHNLEKTPDFSAVTRDIARS